MKLSALLHQIGLRRQRMMRTGMIMSLAMGLTLPASAALVIITDHQQSSSPALPLSPTWPVAVDSLIAGKLPSASSGNFALQSGAGGLSRLTDGMIGPVNTNGQPAAAYAPFATAGSDGGFINSYNPSVGTVLVYTLTNSGDGYDVTNLTVFSGWQDNGRDAQAYAVYYSQVATPTNWIYLGAVNYNPTSPGGYPSANRVMLADSTNGIIAANVGALKFDFTIPVENGWCGYLEVTAQGMLSATTPTPQPAIVMMTQYGRAAAAVETPNLIRQMLPAVSAGNFVQEGCAGLPAVTDGAVGAADATASYATVGGGGGNSMTYTLTNTGYGFDLTNIVFYSGWGNYGRDGQYYSVAYSTVAAPMTFIPLTTVVFTPQAVNYNPVTNRVAIAMTDGSVLAHNVGALKFDFVTGLDNPAAYDNGYQGCAEIVAQGRPAASAHFSLAANPFRLAVPYGGSISQPVIGVYASAVDANGQPVFLVEVTQGTNGTVTFTGTHVTYTATNGAVADQFDYVVSDTLGERATNTVTTYLLPPPVNIMPLGDSITWGDSSPGPVAGGYYYPLYQLLTNLNYRVHYVGTVANNSPPGFTFNVEGHRAAQLGGVDALLPGVFSEIDDPDVILLLLGTNDYGLGSPSGATNRLDQIITDLATQRPRAKILVANLLIRTDDNGFYWSEITNQFNPYVPGIVAAHAAQGQSVYFVDLSGGFTSGGLSPDNLHPSAAGYATMAGLWLPAITNVLSPFGTTNQPAVAHVVAPAGLTNLLVTFSKPMGPAATNAAHYSLNGGLTVLRASLDEATRRVVTLTTSPQQPDTAYVLTVNDVTDFTPAATMIVPGSSTGFQSSAITGVTNHVPEAVRYTLVYDLDIPSAANYGGTNPVYRVDHHATIGPASRLAYYVELQASNGPLQYLWVSLDPFTQNLSRIGVPTLASGAVFQQNVTNMNVYSDVPGIVTGSGLTGGNIEFWPYNYQPANAANVPGANANVYDDGDQNLASGNYGCLQIANHDAGQMLFSFNQWGGNNSGNVDLGIGNNLVYYEDNGAMINAYSDIHPDWTFRGNGADYVVKRLQVYVAVPQPVALPLTVSYLAGTTVSLALTDLATNWSDVPGQVLAFAGADPASSNGTAIVTNGLDLVYHGTGMVEDQINYHISDTAGVTATGMVHLVPVSAAEIGGRASAVSITNGRVRLTFSAKADYKYHVQISTNLRDWNDLSVTDAPAGGSFQFTDANSARSAAYYRLMWDGD